MAKPHDIELMQHADGELDNVEIDEASRAKVDAVNEMGELVRGHLELSADAVPQSRFDAMWREMDKIISVKNAAEGVRPTAAPVVEGGVFRKISRWFDRYRAHIVVGAVSAGAVAALAIMIGPRGGDAGFATTNGPIEVRPAALRALPAVESLDTPGGSSNMFEVDDEDGHAAVIWVTPQDTVEGI